MSSKLIQRVDSGVSTADSKADMLAKQYYASCIDISKKDFNETRAYLDLNKKLAEIGGWPLLGNDTRTTNSSDLFLHEHQ